MRTVCEGFGGWCQDLSGYTSDCGLTKHGRTYYQYMDFFKIFDSKFQGELDPNEINIEIWNNEVKGHVSIKAHLGQKIQKACGVLIQQCMDNMKAALKARPDFKLFNREADVLSFIGIIKGMVFKFE